MLYAVEKAFSFVLKVSACYISPFCSPRTRVYCQVLLFFRRPQGHIKAHELRGKTKEELSKQLSELKTELSTLRVAKVTGGAASKLGKM